MGNIENNKNSSVSNSSDLKAAIKSKIKQVESILAELIASRGEDINFSLPSIQYSIPDTKDSGEIRAAIAHLKTVCQLAKEYIRYRENDNDISKPKKRKLDGDLNEDGRVDWHDVIFLEMAINGDVKLTDEQMRQLDLNHDGVVDAKDVIIEEVKLLPPIIVNNLPKPSTNNKKVQVKSSGEILHQKALKKILKDKLIKYLDKLFRS
ncbi:MAG: hypothetical protein HY094_04560 [Candidatus Melainabacteria bacterium]|nr:hypothetical protein [Candidatus Melainabacteria bacterium]